VANIASAEKKNRQRLKRRERNLYHLTTMRTFVKRVRSAVADKDAKGAQEALSGALRQLDMAAQKGAIKKQTAARTKSRLALAVNGLSA
jgi:small subunit ribosomal protein S20